MRLIAGVIALTAFYPATHYLRHLHFPFPSAPTVDNQYEYVLAKWTHDHLPSQRVLPSGSVRFWFDAWFENPQQHGGSDQGILNPVLPAVEYQITNGDRGRDGDSLDAGPGGRMLSSSQIGARRSRTTTTSNQKSFVG